MSSSEGEIEVEKEKDEESRISSLPESPTSPKKDDCSSQEHQVHNDTLSSSSPSSMSISPFRSSTPNNNNNGVLTPSDSDQNESCISNTSKNDSPGGRLKFYKDGVLCLELSHDDNDNEDSAIEGCEKKKTKWVQIRSKTVYPTIIQVTKDSTPPCMTLNNTTKFEIPSSNSLSDDGSPLSSPKHRESIWKQPVPQQRISYGLQFYMKPALCAIKLRGQQRIPIRKSRQNFLFNFTTLNATTKSNDCSNNNDDTTEEDKSSAVTTTNKQNSCLCKITTKENDNAKNGEILKTETESSSSPSTTKVVNNKTIDSEEIRSETKKSTNCSSPYHLSSMRIDDLANILLKNAKINTNNSSFVKNLPPYTASTPQRKRAFNKSSADYDYDMKGFDLSSSPRPKRRSPNLFIGKTILTVPDYNVSSKNNGNRKNIGRSSDISLLKRGIVEENGEDSSNRRGIDTKQKNFNNKNNANSRNSSPCLGAKSKYSKMSMTDRTCELVSTNSNLNLTKKKSAIVQQNSSDFNSSNINTSSSSKRLINDANFDEHLFHQQTMSKAISYTINSLLGTNCNNNDPNQSLDLRTTTTLVKNTNNPISQSSDNDHKSGSSGSSGIKKDKSIITPPIINDQDQTSFLRHLLDTSIPIPVPDSKNKSSVSVPVPDRNSVTVSNVKQQQQNNPNPKPKHKTGNSLSRKPEQSSNFKSKSNNQNHNQFNSTTSSLGSSTSTSNNNFTSIPTSTASDMSAALHYNNLVNSTFLPQHLGNAAAAFLSGQMNMPPQLQFNPLSLLGFPGFLPMQFQSPSPLNLNQNILEDLKQQQQQLLLHQLQLQNQNNPSNKQHGSSTSSSNASKVPKKERKETFSNCDNAETPLNLVCKKPRPN